MSLETHEFSLPQLEVVLKHQDETSKRMILEITPGFRIGRDTDADFRLNDPTVSRLHAELRVVRKTIEIRDLSSSFGIYISDSRIPPETWTPIGLSDSVWLGEMRLQCKLLKSGSDEQFNPTVALSRITSMELTLSTNDEDISYSVPVKGHRVFEEKHLPPPFRRQLAAALPLKIAHVSPLALHIRPANGEEFVLSQGEISNIGGIELRVLSAEGDWNLSSVAMSREALLSQFEQAPVNQPAANAEQPGRVLPLHSEKPAPERITDLQARAYAAIEAFLLFAAVVLGIVLLVYLFSQSPVADKHDSLTPAGATLKNAESPSIQLD